MFLRRFACQILAPGDGLHPESLCDLCDFGTDVAQTDQADRFPVEIATDGRLPLPCPYGSKLCGDITEKRENERPGHFKCTMRAVACVAYCDTALVCRNQVDRGISRTSRRDQLQLR